MSQRDVKKWSWFDSIPSQVPISIQTALIATVALSLCLAVSVFGTALVVNRLKNNLVDEAREEARRTAETASEQIRSVVERSGASSISEIVRHPEVRRELEILSNEGAISVAAILDENGQIIYQKFCKGSLVSERSALKGLRDFKPNASRILAQEGEEPLGDNTGMPPSIIPVKFPIQADGRTVGHIQIGLAAQPNLGRIDTLSQQITTNLSVMVLIVFSILLLTIALVYNAFRRQMELRQRAVHAEHLASIGALASGLAHEIRNPLHAMNLHLEVAREDLEAEEEEADRSEAGRTIQSVQRQIEQLNSIVSGFLNAAAPPRMEFSEMRMCQLLREVTCFLRPDFENRGIEVEVDLPEEIVIEGDRQALYQVLMNLLINARQALERGDQRRIRISAERERKCWKIYIEDSGPGLPEGEKEMLFKTFVTKRSGGTGFGLSIARRIVEAHGGRIGAEKSGLGGACFFLELPAL